MKALARKSALSYKAKDNAITIVEDFTMESPKTKEFVSIVKDLKLEGKKMLFVLPENDRVLYLSARNLPQTRVMNASELNTYRVMDAATLVFTEKSLAVVEQLFNA